MINLLPPKQKEELTKDEIYKMAMILGMVICVSLISLVLMLVAVRWYYLGQLYEKTAAADELLLRLKMLKVEEGEKKIMDYNALFSGMAKFYEKQQITSDIFDKLAESMPEGSHLTNFNFNEGKISVSGYCPDREKLVVFKNKLESQEDFENIYFSPSNWIKQKDINFNVSFELFSDRDSGEASTATTKHDDEE